MRFHSKETRYKRKTLLRRRSYKPRAKPAQGEPPNAPADNPQTLAPPGDKGLDQLTVQQ